MFHTFTLYNVSITSDINIVFVIRCAGEGFFLIILNNAGILAAANPFK